MTTWREARIPPQTSRFHGSPYWYGDSKWAIKDADLDIDLNLRELLDGVGLMHDGTPEQGGWRFLQEGRKRRPLTDKELRTPYSKWPRPKFVRLRQTKRRGITRRSRVRPLLYVEALDLLRRYDKRGCFELKTRMGRARAMRMVAQARAHRATAYWMTLALQSRKRPRPGYSMAAAGEKLRDFHVAGGQTALLLHNLPKPSDLDEWEPFIDRKWGRWSE